MKTLRESRDLIGPIIVSALLLWSVGKALGQDVALEVKGGDSKIVKVDKVIIVKEDRLVIQSFPFFVHAPQSEGLYFWTVPPNVKATDQGDKLRIDDAPKGMLTVSLKLWRADWDTKKYVTKFGSISMSVGDVTPPKPPDPPAPDTPLARALKEAWAKESLADKGKLSLYIAASANASASANDSAVTTVKQVRDRFVADSIAPALPNLRAVVGAELDAKLPRAVNAVLDDENRRLISSTFDAIAAGLRGLQ